jgi:hypothetical protein
MDVYTGSAHVDALEQLELAVFAQATATPYVGFRAWRLIDGVLRSPYRHKRWEQPVLEATCAWLAAGPARAPAGAMTTPHRAPHPDCRCGVYVSDRPNLAFPQVDFRGVTGIVTAWGTVLCDEDGTRAEFAKVAALGVYSHWTARQKDAVAEAARGLEADLVDLDALEAAAPRYGTTLPAPSSAPWHARPVRGRLSADGGSCPPSSSEGSPSAGTNVVAAGGRRGRGRGRDGDRDRGIA